MSRLFFTLFCCFIHGASAQWPCARTEGKCMKKADCIKLGLSPFRYVSGVRSCKNNDMCCRDPYDENPCLALGGNCMDENTCLRAGGNVMRLTATGKFVCPTQPNNILCCTKSAKTAQNKCGFASPPESEIGKSAGQIANRSKWPWMALLSGNSGGHWSCAGVLISPTAVLTAAHCVSNE